MKKILIITLLMTSNVFSSDTEDFLDGSYVDLGDDERDPMNQTMYPWDFKVKGNMTQEEHLAAERELRENREGYEAARKLQMGLAAQKEARYREK